MPLIQWIMQNLFGGGPKVDLTCKSTLQVETINYVHAQVVLSAKSSLVASSDIHVFTDILLKSKSTITVEAHVILGPKDFLGGLAGDTAAYPTDFAF